jgi:hypothetical protein
VRRRRLFERYAILWLGSTLLLTAFAVWGGGLDLLKNLLGIASAPNALFAMAFGFVLVLLLHFSVAVSRLSDQSKVLAQRLALLEERLREQSEEETTDEPEPRPVPIERARRPPGA